MNIVNTHGYTHMCITFSWLCTCIYRKCFNFSRVKARAKSLRIFDNWNIAYSGIKLESVRKVLDCGDLLSLGKLEPYQNFREMK